MQRVEGLGHFKCPFLLGKEGEREVRKNEEKENHYNYLNKTMKIATHQS